MATNVAHFMTAEANNATATIGINEGYPVTYNDPGDIKQLIGKHIPITINGEEITAKVEFISPFLKLGWRVLFTIGTYPVKEYINVLNNFYIEEKKY